MAQAPNEPFCGRRDNRNDAQQGEPQNEDVSDQSPELADALLQNPRLVRRHIACRIGVRVNRPCRRARFRRLQTC